MKLKQCCKVLLLFKLIPGLGLITKAVYDYKNDYIVVCVYDCHYVQKMLDYI